MKPVSALQTHPSLPDALRDLGTTTTARVRADTGRDADSVRDVVAQFVERHPGVRVYVLLLGGLRRHLFRVAAHAHTRTVHLLLLNSRSLDDSPMDGEVRSVST